jgi:hypothetical protein
MLQQKNLGKFVKIVKHFVKGKIQWIFYIKPNGLCRKKIRSITAFPKLHYVTDFTFKTEKYHETVHFQRRGLYFFYIKKKDSVYAETIGRFEYEW